MAFPTKQQKEDLLKKWATCYVCDALGLPDADFAGYSLKNRDIQFDHWLPKARIGDDQAQLLANLRPIHAVTGAPSPADPGWASASRRNCHKGKSNKYDGKQWVEVAHIIHLLDDTNYIEDLLPKRSFEDEPDRYRVTIDWDASEPTVNGSQVEIQTQEVDGKAWRSIATAVSPQLLWTDHEAQPRKANRKRLRAVAEDLLDHPLLSPIHCRLGPDGRLLVSDGNHRLCGFQMVRPNAKIPIVIWDVPSVTELFEVLAASHDKLTQQKYQFSDKALKYSAVAEDDLAAATEKHGAEASERLAWDGLRASEVKLRVLGKLNEMLSEDGYRTKWLEAGLRDGSWKFFLEQYCNTGAATVPFDSPNYHRVPEAENIAKLVQIFDEELIDYIIKDPKAGLRDSLKSKWWAEGHRIFSQAFKPTVRDLLGLQMQPERLAYTTEWNDKVISRLRKGVVRWRESPVWRDGVVRTANNEPDVRAVLVQEGFTEAQLQKDV